MGGKESSGPYSSHSRIRWAKLLLQRKAGAREQGKHLVILLNQHRPSHCSARLQAAPPCSEPFSAGRLPGGVSGHADFQAQNLLLQSL